MIVGLATASRSASSDGALVARRDEGEDPELGQREVARRRGPFEGAGRQRQRPGGPRQVGGGIGHGRPGYRTVREPNYLGPTRPTGARAGPAPGMIPGMANALGIDVGTTNVKVALVRDDGTTVGERPAAARR